jgi:hypothetical protein
MSWFDVSNDASLEMPTARKRERHVVGTIPVGLELELDVGSDRQWSS